MVQKGVLQRIGRGTFKLGTENKYLPEVSSQMKTVYRKVKNNFPYLDLCIWNTASLNQFMIHQPGQYFTLVEVEQDAVEAIFHHLKELKSSVFLEPGEEIMENYVSDNENAYIVQTLVSEAPVMHINKVTCPTLEKILVDIFCDDTTFFAYQGSERSTIYKEAFNRYTVNQNKLFRYANRRGKKQELSAYLESLKLLAINED